jgi:hypothetical protein
MSKPIEVPIKFGGIAEVRKEIKQLQGELINATNPEKAKELSQSIGDLRNRLADANEQANLFASGSKYEQAANGLGSVKNALLNLDFEKARDRAASLAKIAGSITFKDAIGSLKQLGSTFVTLGKTLLTNPLFLIGAVIAAVAIAVVKLADKLGFLKKITESVGKAMDALWNIAKRVLSIIPAFREAFATDDLIKDSDKRIAQLKKEEASIGDKYDFEIRKLKAAGLSTDEAEREKRKAIFETLKAQNDALRVLIQTGKATEDQIKVWNENQNKIKKLKEDAIIAELEAEKRAKDEYAKLQKERSDAAAKAAADAAAAAKKYAADRQAFERTLRDLEIAAIENDTQREIAANKEKYARIIEDTLASENLLQEEKEALILAYEKERERNKQAILDKEFNDTKSKIEAEQQAILDAELRNKKALLDAQLLIDQESFEKTLANKQALLDFEREQALANKELTEGEKFLIETEYAAKSQELLDAKAEADKARAQQVAKAQEDLAINAINAISANLKEGSKAAKGIAAAQAGYDAIRGAQAAFASTAANPVSIAFPAAPFIAAATALAFGVANVRKILASPDKASGAPSGGASSAPPKPQTGQLQQQGTPSFNLFGSGNQLGQTDAAENRESTQQTTTIKAVVSETDITDTQERVSKLRQTAEL